MQFLPSGRQHRRQPVRTAGHLSSAHQGAARDGEGTELAQCRGDGALFPRWQRRNAGRCREADGGGATRPDPDRSASDLHSRLSANADGQLPWRAHRPSCTMRAALSTATFLTLVLLLTWLSLRAANPEAELFDHALMELNRFVMLENALYRDVFAARSGTLRN